jgi:nucleotide-binding universal stress UspA family protein
MVRTIQSPAGEDLARPLAFRSVVCGIGGGPLALEAARQAATVAAGGALELVAVAPAGAEARADEDLAAACDIANACGVSPAVRRVRGDRATPALLLLAAHHDLLVIGAHEPDADRPDSAHAAVHQSPVPVLVARPVPGGAEVTARILVAVDGTPEAQAAMVAARSLAERHGSHLAVLNPPLGAGEEPADAIVQGARRLGATLVVVGSRGLSGVAALQSVSTRVAARAHCSVLIMRG